MCFGPNKNDTTGACCGPPPAKDCAGLCAGNHTLDVDNTCCLRSDIVCGVCNGDILQCTTGTTGTTGITGVIFQQVCVLLNQKKRERMYSNSRFSWFSDCNRVGEYNCQYHGSKFSKSELYLMLKNFQDMFQWRFVVLTLVYNNAGTVLQFLGAPPAPMSILTDATILATDMTWCGNLTGDFELNGNSVGSFNKPSSDMNCTRICQNCSNNYSFKLPNFATSSYNDTGLNTMELNVMSGKACFTSLLLILTYDEPEMVKTTTTGSKSPQHSPLNLLIIEIVVPIGVLILLLASVTIFCLAKRRRNVVEIPLLTTWNIKNVVVLDRLGGGHFGDVYLGVLDVRIEITLTMQGTTRVALKKLKSVDSSDEFHQEVAVLR